MNTTTHVRKRERWEDATERFSERFITTCHCNGAGYVRTNAPVNHILFGKAIPCICQRDDQKRQRAESLRKASGITVQELTDLSFPMFQPELARPVKGQTHEQAVALLREVKTACEKYAENPAGWLVLRGGTGTGKTHLAYAIAGACIKRDITVFAKPVPDLLDMLRDAYAIGAHGEQMAMLKDVELLVLDDLGAQRDTGWALDTLYQVVNHRYSKRLPMIVTTNVDLNKVALDERLVSRLLDGIQAEHGFSRVLIMPCADFRPHRKAA